MTGIARLGDLIGHAGAPTGSIISVSSTVLCEKDPVALVGDAVLCSWPGHAPPAGPGVPFPPPNVILPGPMPLTVTIKGGKQMALVGYMTTCGATILTGSTHVSLG